MILNLFKDIACDFLEITFRMQLNWRAEGVAGQTGRRPRASKAGGHTKTEITKI